MTGRPARSPPAPGDPPRPRAYREHVVLQQLGGRGAQLALAGRLGVGRRGHALREGTARRRSCPGPAPAPTGPGHWGSRQVTGRGLLRGRAPRSGGDSRLHDTGGAWPLRGPAGSGGDAISRTSRSCYTDWGAGEPGSRGPNRGAQGQGLTRCWHPARTAPSCPPWWKSRLQGRREAWVTGGSRHPGSASRTSGTAGLQGRVAWGLLHGALGGGGQRAPRAKDKKRPRVGVGSHKPRGVTAQPTLGEELSRRPCPASCRQL